MDVPFRQLLRDYRLAAGLTQEALAARAGLGVRSIQGMERGEHRPLRHTLDQLADALVLVHEERTRFLAASSPTPRRRITAAIGPTSAANAPITPRSSEQPGNLPIQLTTFVGRIREIVAVTDLLATTRLLTLTGTGGVGKTRLGLQVAAAVVGHYSDGVWLVELASVAQPSVVPGAVLAMLGLQEQAGRSATDTLLDALRTRQMLVVFDNCEHLLDACARLAEALLRTCPRVQILATSREPLGLAGETHWRVPSLSVPLNDQLGGGSIARSEAVQLFLERAGAVHPGFAHTPSSMPAVASICARLDGIPLALELAAARLSAMGVADLASHLDQRFQLLTGGGRTALPRQQTLRAMVEWSYRLLTPQEQTCFARLSVFAGGFQLEAAEAVCAAGDISGDQVLDLLVRLVDKSLVVPEELDDDRTRYRLLETLRQYGQERLAESGEMVGSRARHTAYYVLLSENADRELIGPDALHWFDLLEREFDNLRGALAWCLARNQSETPEEDAQAVETGARLAGNLRWFWLFHDHHPEGLMWLDRVLAHDGVASGAVRARALYSAGILTGRLNDLARSQALLTECVAVCRQTGDMRQLSEAVSTLGWAMWRSGQLEEADKALQEGLAIAHAVGEPWHIAFALMNDVFRVAHSAALERAEERARASAAGAQALHLFHVAGDRMNAAMVQFNLGQLALHEGDYAPARAALVACMPVLRALGWKSTVTEGLVRLAEVAGAQNDYAAATALYDEAVTLYRHLGDQFLTAIAWVRSRQAALALEQGEFSAAQLQLTESLLIAQTASADEVPELAGAIEARAASAALEPAGLKTSTTTVLPSALELQAALAAGQGRSGQALRLAGAAAALRAHLNRPLAAAEQVTLERWLAVASQGLTAHERASAWAAGHAMTPEQAIADALDRGPSI